MTMVEIPSFLNLLLDLSQNWFEIPGIILYGPDIFRHFYSGPAQASITATSTASPTATASLMATILSPTTQSATQSTMVRLYQRIFKDLRRKGNMPSSKNITKKTCYGESLSNGRRNEGDSCCLSWVLTLLTW
jgi:hypothetical protein